MIKIKIKKKILLQKLSAIYQKQKRSKKKFISRKPTNNQTIHEIVANPLLDLQLPPHWSVQDQIGLNLC